MISRVFSYIKYRWQSTTAHGVHSPFVYDLITNLIYNKTSFYAYRHVEAIRNALLNNRKEIEIQDFGAGSKMGGGKFRRISDIARTSVKSTKYSQLLFRLAESYKPNSIVELGTSLGLTSLYFALACPKAKIITVEADPNLAKLADSLFQKQKKTNIEVRNRTFKEEIPAILKELDTVDFVFFDGHHDGTATLEYFQAFLNKINEDTVFVFDDINWSSDMQKAWQEIKAHEKVSLSIDLFEMGIVYFKSRFQKENFVVRF